MFCNFCGTELPHGAAFCPECGKPSPKGTSAPVKNPAPKAKTTRHSAGYGNRPRKDRRLLWISLLAVAALLLVVSLFLFVPGLRGIFTGDPTASTKESTSAAESMEEFVEETTESLLKESETEIIPPITQSPEPSAEEIILKIETITIGESIQVEYPVLQSERYADIISGINEEWCMLAEEVAASFQQEMAGEEDSFLHVSLGEPYIQGSCISLAQATTAYTGGAHPLTALMAYNLDLVGPTVLTPGDWLGCDPQVALEAAVLAGTRMEAVTTGEVTLEQVRDTLADDGNYIYYMADDGLHIRFQLYSLSSYHIGTPELIITPLDVTTAANILSNGKQVETGATPQNTEAATKPSETTTSGTGGVTAPPAPAGNSVAVYYGLTADSGDFLFPYSSTEVLTDADLKKLEAATVEQMHSNSQLAINEILARYGYKFKPESSDTAREVWERFCNLKWYQKAMEECPYTKGSQVLEAMNEVERANVDLINQWQKDHGCYY